MRKTVLVLILAIFLCAASPVWAGQPVSQKPLGKYAGNWCCEPPRFQLFEAPRPYGGLLMVDTQTGETYQRIIVNSPKVPGGIDIRWMKIEKKGPDKDETILWD